MLKLTLAYDGTQFYGSQFQSRSGVEQRTVQGELEAAILRLTGLAVRVSLAGRTDSGVHAEGQVAGFEPPAEGTATRLQTGDWLRALNAHLPPDIRVWLMEEAEAGFHPRFSATRRTYEYCIWQAAVPSPIRRLYSHHVSYALDVVAMNAAAGQLVGEHDFASFAGNGWGKGEEDRSTVRRMDAATVNSREQTAAGTLVVVRLAANAFLPHMVRNIVGTLLLVGGGKMTTEQFTAVLAAKNRQAAGPTAPPQGLCLLQVEY